MIERILHLHGWGSRPNQILDSLGCLSVCNAQTFPSNTVSLTRNSWSEALWCALQGQRVDILTAAGNRIVQKDVEILGVGDPSCCQLVLGNLDPSHFLAAGQQLILSGTMGDCPQGIGALLSAIVHPLQFADMVSQPVNIMQALATMPRAIEYAQHSLVLKDTDLTITVECESLQKQGRCFLLTPDESRGCLAMNIHNTGDCYAY